MKVCIAGAGSSYTPELIEKFAECKEKFPVTDITLYDIDQSRLDAVGGFVYRYAAKLGLHANIAQTDQLDRALYGADFVNVQIRVGGNKCRVQDERIPLSMGVIGQETTGAGGFMKALRTVPKMLEIAACMEREAPNAWLINYTNPTGIVGQALSARSKVKFSALCAGGIRTQWRTSEALGVDPDDVRYDIFGLNHLNFTYNIKINGRRISPAEFTKVAAKVKEVDPKVSLKLNAIPSAYLQYYYHRTKKLNDLLSASQTRGEQVLELEREIFEDFRDTSFHDKPLSLKKRGGGGYSSIAIKVMNAIWNNQDTWCVANVPNRGTFRCLPDGAVIETAVIVNASGITPLAAEDPPGAVWGLVAAVKNYEMLTADAAAEGNMDAAILALASHPLMCDYDMARKLFEKMLEANREYLPMFFKKLR